MLFLFVLFSSWMQASPIVLAPGVSQKIEVTGQSEVVVGNSSIVKIRSLERSLLATGLKPGITNLRLSKEVIAIHVLSKEDYVTFLALQSRLAGSQGLEINTENGDISVEGVLWRLSDWQKIKLPASRSYQMRARVPADLREKAESWLRSLAIQNGVTPPTLGWTPTTQILFPMSAKAQEASIVASFSGLGLKPTFTDQVVNVQPLVRLATQIVEIRRSTLQKMGIAWPSSLTAQVVPQLQSAAKVFSVDLQALETEGEAKVLAQPNLLCKSGKEAQFFVGGEIPIKIMNYKTQDVIWKKYGVQLKFEPLVDFRGRMNLSISTEVSELDPSHTVDGIPGIIAHQLQSHFDLESARTIVLSGLIKQDQARSGQGLPGLRQIPILGMLFGSEDWRENRSELVIFVTPQVEGVTANTKESP